MANGYVAVTKKLTEEEKERIAAPMVLDFIALFNTIKDDVVSTLDEGVKAGKLPEVIIQEVKDLI